MTNNEIIISIAIISVVTAAVRFLPFAVFSGKNIPKAVTEMGKLLPPAIMGMLVVYCLKDTGFASAADFAPALISAVVVVVSYIIKKNTLVSIIGGTVCYMLLIQFVFV